MDISCNVHSYNKCKDLDHLFIICGAVHASCISRNFIHVNHKTFQELKTFFLFNLQKNTVAFRCVWYLVVPQTGNQNCVHIHPLLIQYPGFYGATVVNVLPAINKNGYIHEWKYYLYYFSRSLPSYPILFFNQSMFASL